jgi:hypothetical protein
MTNEQLRMQMLAGVITESEYRAVINKQIEDEDKESLNESMIGGIVGIGAINQIPATPKTDYEMAFEHFLGSKYINEDETSDMEAKVKDEISMNEAEGSEMVDFVKQNFDTIKDNFYKSEKDIITNDVDYEDGEDASTFISYLDNQINKVSTAEELIDLINDRSIGVDLEGEEASELFDMIKQYASLEEGKEVEDEISMNEEDKVDYNALAAVLGVDPREAERMHNAFQAMKNKDKEVQEPNKFRIRSKSDYIAGIDEEEVN